MLVRHARSDPARVHACRHMLSFMFLLQDVRHRIAISVYDICLERSDQPASCTPFLLRPTIQYRLVEKRCE